MGSIIALTDHRGKTIQSYEYSAFGELNHHGNKIKQPYTYTAREWDKKTGLYYYRARYYDPGMGRFISKDPIGFAGGHVNLYNYVGSNPINAIDPKGLQKIYGNWCGPDWTGGYKKSWDQLSEKEKENAVLPVDELDSCCETHDKCYAKCRKDFPCLEYDRKMCFRQCDIELHMCPGSVNIKGTRPYLIKKYMQNTNPGPGDNNPMCCDK